MLGKVIHAAKEVHTFRQQHLDALRQAEIAESNRVCRELVDELRSLDKADYFETKAILLDTCGPAEARDPDELAEFINSLSGEKSPANSGLCCGPATVCACRSAGRFPARRNRRPLRRLSRAARFRRNLATTPIDKMLPLKIQDTLFFPRISDSETTSPDIEIQIIVIGKERKSW